MKNLNFRLRPGEKAKKLNAGVAENAGKAAGMIKVNCLDGPLAGEVRSFIGSRSVEQNQEVNLLDLFSFFLRRGWHWRVDYSAATKEEIILWMRRDMSARIVRALRAGLPVRFQGEDHFLQDGEDTIQAAKRVEKIIVSSETEVTIVSDDQRGVVIGTR